MSLVDHGHEIAHEAVGVAKAATSIVVVNPPPGIDEKTTSPFCCNQRLELLLHLGAHAEVLERLERRLLGLLELQQHALAGLGALAGDACRSTFLLPTSMPKLPDCRDAAVFDLERRQAS